MSRHYLSERNKDGERISGMGNKNGEDERTAG